MNLTGYYVLDGRIHGPRRDGEFWIENDQIFSAEDPRGEYVVHADGQIFGPHGHTAFRLDRASGHILGPHPVLPWLRGEHDDTEEEEVTDALGG
jgi:hypothetical protein